MGVEDGFAVLNAFFEGGGRSIDTADSYTQFARGGVGERLTAASVSFAV